MSPGLGLGLTATGALHAVDAQELAGRLLRVVTAKRQLLDEIDRQSRQQAKLEAAELSMEARQALAEHEAAIATDRRLVAMDAKRARSLLRSALAAWASLATRFAKQTAETDGRRAAPEEEPMAEAPTFSQPFDATGSGCKPNTVVSVVAGTAVAEAPPRTVGIIGSPLPLCGPAIHCIATPPGDEESASQGDEQEEVGSSISMAFETNLVDEVAVPTICMRRFFANMDPTLGQCPRGPSPGLVPSVVTLSRRSQTGSARGSAPSTPIGSLSLSASRACLIEGARSVSMPRADFEDITSQHIGDFPDGPPLTPPAAFDRPSLPGPVEVAASCGRMLTTRWPAMTTVSEVGFVKEISVATPLAEESLVAASCVDHPVEGHTQEVRMFALAVTPSPGGSSVQLVAWQPSEEGGDVSAAEAEQANEAPATQPTEEDLGKAAAAAATVDESAISRSGLPGQRCSSQASEALSPPDGKGGDEPRSFTSTRSVEPRTPPCHGQIDPLATPSLADFAFMADSGAAAQASGQRHTTQDAQAHEPPADASRDANATSTVEARHSQVPEGAEEAGAAGSARGAAEARPHSSSRSRSHQRSPPTQRSTAPERAKAALALQQPPVARSSCISPRSARSVASSWGPSGTPVKSNSLRHLSPRRASTAAPGSSAVTSRNRPVSPLIVTQGPTSSSPTTPHDVRNRMLHRGVAPQHRRPATQPSTPLQSEGCQSDEPSPLLMGRSHTYNAALQPSIANSNGSLLPASPLLPPHRAPALETVASKTDDESSTVNPSPSASSLPPPGTPTPTTAVLSPAAEAPLAAMAAAQGASSDPAPAEASEPKTTVPDTCVHATNELEPGAVPMLAELSVSHPALSAPPPAESAPLAAASKEAAADPEEAAEAVQDWLPAPEAVVALPVRACLPALLVMSAESAIEASEATMEEIPAPAMAVQAGVLAPVAAMPASSPSPTASASVSRAEGAEALAKACTEWPESTAAVALVAKVQGNTSVVAPMACASTASISGAETVLNAAPPSLLEQLGLDGLDSEEEDRAEDEGDETNADALYGIESRSQLHGPDSEEMNADLESVTCHSGESGATSPRAQSTSEQDSCYIDEDLDAVAELPFFGAWRLANLVDKVIRAGMIARKVRGLRSAERAARQECRTSLRQRSALMSSYQKARAKSVAMSTDLAKLRLLAKEREHQVELHRVRTQELVEATARQRRCIGPAFDELRETQMRREAQRLVFEATLAAVSRLQVVQASTTSTTPEAMHTVATGGYEAASSAVAPGAGREESAEQPGKEVEGEEEDEEAEEEDERVTYLREVLSPQPKIQTRDSSSGSVVLSIPGLEPRGAQPGISRGASWSELHHLPEIGTYSSMEVFRSSSLTQCEGAQPSVARKLSALLFEEDVDAQKSPTISVDPRKNTQLARLRVWLAAAPVPLGSTDTTHAGLLATKLDKAPAIMEARGELRDLMAYLLSAYPKLRVILADTERLDDLPAEMQRCGRALSVPERARVLRMGVASELINPQMLAIHLARSDEGDLREAYSQLCINTWLGPYLDARQQELGFGPSPQPESWTKIFHNPLQRFARMCGRLIVDAMREYFCRAMTLRSVEQEGIVRLLEDFAHALASKEEVQQRFEYALLPVAERPKNVTSLEQVVFLLVYLGLLLNTALHNPAAKRKAQTKQEFAMQGCSTVGVQVDCCKKIYDLIRATPLG